MIDELAAARTDGGDGPRPITAAAVAELIGGRLIGDAAVLVSGVAPLDRAGPQELSFFAHQRYGSWFAQTRAGVVLVSPALADAEGTPLARIVVEHPMDAMVTILSRFHRAVPRTEGVHPTAVIAATARIGEHVTIEPYTVVGEYVTIGDRCWIGAHAVVEAGCTLGTDVRMFAGAVLYPQVEVGDRVVLHSGSRVGREGFGFVPDGNTVKRIPHIGRCVLENDVEIGANSCIDRGSVDDTIIGAGTKIDSLVQVAHNVRIGRMCFLASQVGIAGSSRIGDGVQMGGQSGAAGHLTIGAGATLAARTGVIGDVPAGELWSGFPARPHKEQLRAQAAFLRLARLIRPLEKFLNREEQS